MCFSWGQALQEAGGDVGDRDDDDALDGDQQLAVFLDPLDHAFRALEGAFGDADLFARLEVELLGIGAHQGLADEVDVAAVGRRGDQDEHPHLLFGDGGRLGAVCATVDHQLGEVVLLEGLEGVRRGPHEKEGGGQLDWALTASLQCHVGLGTFLLGFFLDAEDAVVENADGVPVGLHWA